MSTRTGTRPISRAVSESADGRQLQKYEFEKLLWDARIDPLRKLMVLAVISHMGKDNSKADPSVERLAYMCNVDVRTIQRHLPEIEAALGLKIDRKPGKRSSFELQVFKTASDLQAMLASDAWKGAKWHVFTVERNPRRPDKSSDLECLLADIETLTRHGRAGLNGATPPALVSPPAPVSPPALTTSTPGTRVTTPPALVSPKPILNLKEPRESARAKNSASKKRASSKPEKSRLPADWICPPDWRAYAGNEGAADFQIDFMAKGFHRHWTGPDAKNALKADWKRTWENWVDREIARDTLPRHPPKGSSNGAHPQRPEGMPDEVWQARLAELAEEHSS